MFTMAVGDVYQVQIHYNIGSERTMNVVHWIETVTCTDPIPARTVAEMCYSLWDGFVATTLFSDETNVILFQVRRIAPTPGVPATLIVGATGFPAITGTGTASPVPSTAAGLVSLYTDLNDKNGRGRIYFPGIQGAAQNDGQLTAGSIAQLETIADSFEADIVPLAPLTGEFHLVVWSRALIAANEVRQGIGHSNLASQRGRRNFPGIGI